MNIRLRLARGVLSLAAALPAAAHPVTYYGTLSSLGEVPPANPPFSPSPSIGTGTALVTINSDDFSMRVQVSFTNLTGVATISHIHCCTPSAGTGTARVATHLPSFEGFPVGVGAGSYDRTFDMSIAADQPGSNWNPQFLSGSGGLTAVQGFALLATSIADGKAYLNVHTSAVGSGEIRAFFSPVPLPATAWLLLSGLAGMFGVSRRARRA